MCLRHQQSLSNPKYLLKIILNFKSIKLVTTGKIGTWLDFLFFIFVRFSLLVILLVLFNFLLTMRVVMKGIHHLFSDQRRLGLPF